MAIGTYEYQSDFARRYYGQGKTEGRAAAEAESVLRVLAARGITISDEVRERVTSCTDHDQLTEWLSRAVHVEAADDLFD